MPIFQLTKELIFPHPRLAEVDGLLAFGGDLTPERLILAYRSGIFPWYSEEDPLLWWSPDPRFILLPQKVKVSRSMKKVLWKKTFKLTFDTSFRRVMALCAELRQEDGTWITPEMIDAYYKLHELGIAHSVEAWHEDELVGGLYGISLGKCFFGESMFSTMSNASKAALITLAEVLRNENYLFIDCQVYTQHLESMGAELISRSDYLSLLEKGLS